MPTVIHVENLSKKYLLTHQPPARYTNLKDVIARNVNSAIRRLFHIGGPEGAPTREELWVLKDLYLSVQNGETLGIIGRNGAGKSTLLKILSRITEPTIGRIRITGRVASLLEVGTGFHPELTGRTNIFLNGVILGMSRGEIKRKFDEIVAFAEIEKFLDTPVKYYSSGMYMRLAFAIAAHLEPEILIVDEVLAVGDSAFQQKCLGKMDDVAKGGRTILFVSHNMQAVQRLCSRAILLDHGRISFDGPAAECVQLYNCMVLPANVPVWKRSLSNPKSALEIQEVRVELLKGETLHPQLVADIYLRSTGAHKPAFVALVILDSAGNAIMQAVPSLEGFIVDSAPAHEVRITVDTPRLVAGRYSLTVWVGADKMQTLDYVDNCTSVEVPAAATEVDIFSRARDRGCILPPSLYEYSSSRVSDANLRSASG